MPCVPAVLVFNPYATSDDHLRTSLGAASALFTPLQVVEAVVLGRATLSKIKQNLVWALLYNVIGIPLAAGALLPMTGVALNPSLAGGMMAFSSLAVLANSLLLRAAYPGQTAIAEASMQDRSNVEERGLRESVST